MFYISWGYFEITEGEFPKALINRFTNICFVQD